MKFQNYRFKDFMLDEEFQQWVLNPDSDANLFWINYLQNYPDKQPEIAKAKAAIQELHLSGLRKEQAFTHPKSVLAEPATSAEIYLVWENITQAIKVPTAAQTTDQAKPTTKVIPIFSFNKWAKIAASILLIFAIGAIFWLRETTTPRIEEITYRTTFGETKKITLPDSSKIFLNANSQLTTAKHWSSDKDREVKLAGEAFFSVVHTQNNQKFKVNLQKGTQVEVLGTEFTVTNRPTLARVVLSQGKVKVAVGEEKEPSTSSQLSSTIMAPGDLVQIDYLRGTLSKSKVPNPEQYAAFMQNKIEFNNSPLSEVARVLQDNYGYKVTFSPASLANKRFTSSSPSNRLDLLFFALEKSFNLQIVQKGKHLTIQPK